jgi:hypothetical protein
VDLVAATSGCRYQDLEEGSTPPFLCRLPSPFAPSFKAGGCEVLAILFVASVSVCGLLSYHPPCPVATVGGAVPAPLVPESLITATY